MWLFNTNRIVELFQEEKMQSAVQAFLRLPSKPVFKALAVLWTVLLAMVFTMIFIVRLALSIPL
jgi:hypothetical protein